MNDLRRIFPPELRELKAAARRSVELAGGGEQFQYVTCVRAAEISKYCSNSEDRQMRIDVAIEADREAGAPIIVGLMARLLGYDLVRREIAHGNQPMPSLEAAGAATSECLEVFQEYAKAMKDGKLDMVERTAVRREIAQAIRALTSIDEQVGGGGL